MWLILYVFYRVILEGSLQGVVDTQLRIMSEVDKQESQKTVVAFITGLLIGGLLVWVFSSTPESKVEEVNTTTNTEQESTSEVTTDASENASDATGKGSITVVDQKAGAVVTLGKIEFPTTNGWVVVRDYSNGVSGNVLGAARYSADEGLVPIAVELVRATVSGSSYQVVFFTNEGDAGFSLSEDKVIDGASATFSAN